MATPVSAARFQGDVKDLVKTLNHGQWASHNRGTRGDGWGPVHGVIIHHFGPYKSLSGAIDLAYDGRSDLPGPLYHGLIDTQGTLHLIGWGRANHAGAGDADVLRHVTAEDYPLPRPDHNSVDGNARFYGICLLNRGDGKQKYPTKQLAAAAKVAALLCSYHQGWTERSVIGHKEWEAGKIDPSLPMSRFRELVHDELRELRR